MKPGNPKRAAHENIASTAARTLSNDEIGRAHV